ncbi:membrane lipoprotein lipid attachment site-containing protein [Bdellovibrio sp. NC01]|uniref:membrane lipoprotein lipid attachment site-containing protein n=1 Tax=Bdellovibrio sp. NC01 TaxID=2220073 RepID=UPI0011577217|nr:membrane lipoprotein lipid attachment site-containing protein [Bdellovibrio sp. NC01]QDK38771.1 hypothetical protein DOE51_14840 [Bdellovibrio sp. NC01]
MKKLTLFIVAALVVTGCSSKKKREEQVLKDQNVTTTLSKEESLGSDTSIGVDEDGHVMHMDKTQLSEYLQNLKYETFKEYEALYGIREYSSKGLAGQVDACNKKASQKKYGGDGTAPKRVDRSDVLNTELLSEWKNFNKNKTSTDTNAKVEVGYNERGQVTAVTKENLLETVDRFQDYRKTLAQKRTELEQSLAACEAKIEDAQ